MAEEQAWTAEDMAAFRKFLSKPTGQRFLASLKRGTPRIRATTNESVALEAKYRQGWEDCIESMLANAREGVKDVQFNTFVDTDN